MKENNMKSNVHKRVKLHWWYFIIAFVIICIASVTGAFVYANSRVHQTVPYTNTWSNAVSDTQDTSSEAQQGLSQIDTGNFQKGNFKNYPIIQVKQKDPNIENILLVGIDATQGNQPEGSFGANRADSIMVLSIDKKSNSLKIASLLRDTKTFFPNTNDYHKLNAAFSYGGIGLQVDIINYAYKLDIQKYMYIDFDGFKNVIDKVGGVPITLTAKEAQYSYINVGTKAGTYNLNGTQALGYTRTRYIDTDFMRTQRQRNVIFAIYNKFKDVNLTTKASVLNECLGYFKTNLSTTELTGTLFSFVNGMDNNIQQISIPTENDGMYTTEESPIWFWNINWNEETNKLLKFLYS